MPKRFPPALIMDIGGGSVEFIRMEQGSMRWRGSYPCGVSVLRRGHHRTEPLSATAIAGLETYLDEVLSPLLSNQAGLEVPALIGAAGIYEVLARHTATGYRGGLRTIDLEVFHCFAKEVIPMDLDQRVAHPSVPRERAELFPVALILIRWVLKQLAVSQLLASPYALKEGALAEMIAE